MKLGVCTTIPGREQMLRTMLESVSPQLDEVRVLACGSDVSKLAGLPSNVHLTFTSDRRSVEARFTLVGDWQGLVYTLDDDVTYQPGYADALAEYAEGATYPVALHGVRFADTLPRGYRPNELQGRAHYAEGSLGGWAHMLGFGWGCWDTRTCTLPVLEALNNDDAQIAVWAQKTKTPLRVIPHDGTLSVCIDRSPPGSIFRDDEKLNFAKRSKILKRHTGRWVLHRKGGVTAGPLLKTAVGAINGVPPLKTPKGGGTLALIIAAKAGADAALFVPACLAGIAKQRLPPGWTLDLRIGVDDCSQTHEALVAAGQSHWFAKRHVGAYVMRNSLIALRSADVYAVFDIDDVMKPGYLAWACRAYPNRIVGASREEKGTRRPWMHGVASFGTTAWAKLRGYRDWLCLADSEIIRRAEVLGIPRHRSQPALYFRRMHSASLIHSPDTGLGSPHRIARQKDIEDIIRRRAFKFTPVIEPLEYCDPASS